MLRLWMAWAAVLVALQLTAAQPGGYVVLPAPQGRQACGLTGYRPGYVCCCSRKNRPIGIYQPSLVKLVQPPPSRPVCFYTSEGQARSFASAAGYGSTGYAGTQPVSTAGVGRFTGPVASSGVYASPVASSGVYASPVASGSVYTSPVASGSVYTSPAATSGVYGAGYGYGLGSNTGYGSGYGYGLGYGSRYGGGYTSLGGGAYGANAYGSGTYGSGYSYPSYGSYSRYYSYAPYAGYGSVSPYSG